MAAGWRCRVGEPSLQPPHTQPRPLLVLARRGRPSRPITFSGSSPVCWVYTWPRAGPGRSPGTPRVFFFGGGHPQAAPGPLHTPAAQLRFCSRSPQKGALPWSLAKLRCSAPANTDLNRSGRYAGEVEPKVVGETLCPAKSDPKKAGQNNRPAPNLGDIASGCHLPAPLLAGGTTANRTSKGPTTVR